jgi:hypothetical protein
MPDRIMQNKEWLFSSIAVAVPLAIIGWWRSKRKSDAGGGGDNVGRDKIVKK